MGLSVPVRIRRNPSAPFRADHEEEGPNTQGVALGSQLRAVGAAERNDLPALVDGLKTDCGFFTAPSKSG
jgi:hypothetical protein